MSSHDLLAKTRNAIAALFKILESARSYRALSRHVLGMIIWCVFRRFVDVCSNCCCEISGERSSWKSQRPPAKILNACNMPFSLRILSLAFVFCFVAIPLTSDAEMVTVPDGFSSIEGNDGDFLPLSFGYNPLLTSWRWQQVYGASAFSGGAGYISSLAFRFDDSSNVSAASGNTGNLEISLSTTTQAVDGLSTTFADNIGSDETVVLTGTQSLIGTNQAGSAHGVTPNAFEFVFSLDTPFYYDPNSGNLLMDVTSVVSAGSGAVSFEMDAEDTLGDSISRVYTNAVQNDSNAPVGISSSLGLVTQFTFMATPEPASMLMFSIALPICLSRRRAG